MLHNKSVFLNVTLLTGTLLSLAPCLAAKPHKAAAKHHHAAPAPETAEPAARSTWQQDPTLQQQLAAPSLVVDFTLRPPQDYTLSQKDENREADTVLISTWAGEARADGSAPKLRVQITKLKYNAVTLQNLDDRLTTLLAAMSQQAPWLVYSPTEQGRINGASFERVYFKGGPETPAGHRVTHGFVYKATSNDGKYLVTIVADDSEPYNNTTVPLMEASVLTFRQLPH